MRCGLDERTGRLFRWITDSAADSAEVPTAEQKDLLCSAGRAVGAAAWEVDDAARVRILRGGLHDD